MKDFGLSREVPVKLGATALLFVDVQNYSAEGGGRYAGLASDEIATRYGYFFRAMRERVVPNMQRLQYACRQAGVEILFTVIESLTLDGREMGLDYKVSGLFCPKGSRDARVLDAIAPKGDEIVLPKTSSSPFISTNIHYLLCNLGVKHLIVSGVLTDQCIDSTVRDACDYGYLVTLVTDACTALSEAQHDTSVLNNRGYCRQRTTHEMITELESLGSVRRH
jgi:ureidoacrylate peracid hydrolase